jgi:pimeloyl-ACP methyl ester carboxylesterase
MYDTTPASAYSVLECPVRLLTGERSPIAAQTVVGRLAESVSSAQVCVIPSAGHMAPLTHSEAVNAVVFNLLEHTEAP